MSTVQVSGLQVIALYASDLARSRAFYVDRLGFVETEKMDPGILLRAGDLTLYLEGGRAARPAAPLRHPEFSPCLAVPSVRAAHADLKAAGVTIVGDYQEFGPQFAMFRIADPDGNVVEFAGKP